MVGEKDIAVKKESRRSMFRDMFISVEISAKIGHPAV